jgi:hypothetical protein
MIKTTSIICLTLSRKTDTDKARKLIKATSSPTTPTNKRKSNIVYD